MTAPNVGFGVEPPFPVPGEALDDRALAAFRNLVISCFPQLALFGIWDYRVTLHTLNDSHAVVDPVDPTRGLPSAVRVAVTPSMLGEGVTLTPGQRVVLAFLDGNAGKPIILAGDPDVDPLNATLFGGVQGAARVGDSVAVGWISVAGSGVTDVTFSATPLPPGPLVAEITASISQGSLKFKVG